MHRRRAVLPTTLLTGLLAASACGTANIEEHQPTAPPPQPSPPPQVSIPKLATDGGVSCAKSRADDCLPWRQPQPADASWRDIVAVRDQTVDDAPVGASYLCGMYSETDMHRLAGPHAVRGLDGNTCVINSYEGPGWVPQDDGHITLRVNFGHTPETNTPTHASRTITGPDGTPVSVDVIYEQGQPDAPGVAGNAAQHLQQAIAHRV